MGASLVAVQEVEPFRNLELNVAMLQNSLSPICDQFISFIEDANSNGVSVGMRERALRLYDDYFGLWFPLGVLVGISVIGLLVLSGSGNSFADWANSYQTLIGAVVAVVAALLTILSTHKSTQSQIRESRRTYENRRAEKLRASRALLPFALTELVQFCETTSGELSAALPGHQQLDQPQSGDIFVLSTGSFKAAQFPEDVLERIQDVIESAPDDIARELGALLTCIQIYTSRLRSLEEQSTRSIAAVKTSYQVIRIMINICELHAQASRCFEYGRFKSNSIAGEPISQAEIRSSAMLMHLNADDEMFSKLVAESFSRP